ncbi:hypothetical protein AB0K14_07695 [Actinosynnema sp. NPDC050801]|uniref:hypothetical protein n=1 Tax=unclassified Actinosynnema TaxID=2637065 RepID=UPI0033C61B77
MDADRALWFSVWWPWLVLWTVTATCLSTTAAILWVARRRWQNPRRIAGICYYLDEHAVLDLSAVYGPTLVKEARTTEYAVRLGDLKTSSSREVVRTYVAVAEPIMVVNSVLEALETTDGLVEVDLTAGTMRVPTSSRHGRSATLREVDGFVSVEGYFRTTSRSGDTAVLVAPFGDPDDPESGPRVSVHCAVAHLLVDPPEGTFAARCLGRVQAWDAERGELTIRPIALFA